MCDILCFIYIYIYIQKCQDIKNIREAKDKAVITEGALLHVLRLISRMRRCRVQNNLAVLWQSVMQTIQLYMKLYVHWLFT